MALSNKQKRFIEEYLTDPNPTKAAIRAGYNPRSARKSAFSNMRNPLIHEAIDRAMRQRSKTIPITQEKVIQELTTIAFPGPKSVIGNSEAATEGEPAKGGATSDRQADVKTYERLRALELLGRHLGMFKDKIEVSGPVGMAKRLEAAARRLQKGEGKGMSGDKDKAE